MKIIDVRINPDIRIKSAINIEAQNFFHVYENILEDKNELIITHCNVGCGVSSYVASILEENGYTNVVDGRDINNVINYLIVNDIKEYKENLEDFEIV